MNVVEVRDEAEFHKMRASWNDLLSRSSANTVFLTWEWLSAWWSAYGKPGELRILAAYDHNELIGLAPLRASTVAKLGWTVPAISFIGDHSSDSDYLDFLMASGRETEVLGSFRNFLDREIDRGAVLLLNEIPESSPTLPVIRALAESRNLIHTEVDVPCGIVRLPASWDEYLKILQPRFRTKVRSVLSKLERRPELKFGFCQDADEVQQMLPVLYDLHTRRWAEGGRPGVFRWDRKKEFYAALSPRLLERDWLRFSWLKWNGRILACQYGFVYEGAYFQLQEGYEPASEHWNLGAGLRAWTIREFLKQGIREYDFMGGMGRHKTDWGAETKLSKRILLAGRSYKNQLLWDPPEWQSRVQESVKKMVPGQWLKPRPQESDWVSKAIAKCYFHLDLPAIVRPLRDQYQLSVGGNGAGRKISWNKRKEASARILYYHRVNDEKDDFFPALSTTLFDEQMRFISRRHKVVSLAELLKHLNSDSREPVVAITFDDGYQDNYLNAFPILQRYGLPATIFLTTGGLDTREPMWFEKLAQAFKETTKESIDLEMDIPRRFWLRTHAERLDSQGRLFGILRTLPNHEREQWFAQILEQLGVPDNGQRRDKMLTWDQVRLMSRHGIDFGGHTVTHPFLSSMPRDQVAWEVSECKRRIEDELQSPVHHFAYPSGRHEDFGLWNKDVIREAGYQAAVSTVWGMNYRSTDRMELRRGGPWEQMTAVFAYKMDWYQLING